jgi:voltage-gated potassium channel Kch
MNSAFFVALRRLRAPLIVLILVFSVSIAGMVMIPGVDAEGKPASMGFFHAFYFVAYTATTIGFGEIPTAFTDAQRLWVIFIIFLSVIGWAYAIGKLLAVLQDRGFRQAVLVERFEHEVQSLKEPFYLICGYGETGRLLCRAFDHRNIRFVVLDRDQGRIDELDLEDYRASTPGFAGDVRLPENLKRAGLAYRRCLGVVAVTGDDSANLAVAIAARLLNPDLPALCRASHSEVIANMASFGTDHILDPYDKFGEYLALAIRSAGSFQLLDWLTGIPGTHLAAQKEPPKGRWLICGYGRFGKAVVRHAEERHLEATVIDPRQPGAGAGLPWVRGTGTQAETLREAGVGQAVGIIAGTDDDVNNLSIVVTARELNPNLFVVLRQNRTANRDLFQAFDSDFTVVPSEIIAHICLAILTTPLLSRFLNIAKQRDDTWADRVVAHLSGHLGREVPATWRVAVDGKEAPALLPALAKSPVPLDVLRRDPADCETRLLCVPLLLVRDNADIDMPDWDFALKAGDQILFAGRPEAEARQRAILCNANVADYVLTGRHAGDGWLWRTLFGNRGRGKAAR